MEKKEMKTECQAKGGKCKKKKYRAKPENNKEEKIRKIVVISMRT